MLWYSIEPKDAETKFVRYERKCPPNNSVSETWVTIAAERDGAQLVFVEYTFYDKDPDGVREAYGCMYDSEYSLTVNAQNADPKKLFAYTMYENNELFHGFEIDIKRAVAVFVFSEPQPFSTERFATVIARIRNANRNIGEREEILREMFFDGREDGACLAIFPKE